MLSKSNFLRKLCLIVICILSVSAAFAGKRESKNVKVGDTFTVNTTYHNYTNAVLWTYDHVMVEPVTTIYGTTTSVTFKALQPTSSSTVIQAVTYYYRSGTSSSGVNKDMDDFTITIIDDTKVSLSSSSLTLSVGESTYIDAIVTNSSYSGQYDWDSSRPSVISISGSGRSVRIYAESSGESRITVTLDNGQSASCYVVVENTEPTGVEIPGNKTVYVGETTNILAKVTPSNADGTVRWYSVNSAVASVSNGVITGIDSGTTQIYCLTSNNIRSNNCDVTVKFRTPEKITLSSTNLRLALHESTRLTYNVSPSNARYTVHWSSSKENVATVTQDGVVTPKSAGTTVVTVQTDNGIKARCEIWVLPYPESIKLPEKMLLLYGSSRTIIPVFSPAECCDMLSWKSDNDDVVRVSNDGTIISRGAGSANVTVETYNGKKSVCRVDVPAPDFRFFVHANDGSSVSFPVSHHPKLTCTDNDFVLDTDSKRVLFKIQDVSKFTLSDESVSPMPSAIVMDRDLKMQYGDVRRMDFQLLPSDYDFETDLVWSSSDNHVAYVTSSGVVCATGGGEADIMLQASNGCRAVCHVTVPEPDFYFVVWLDNGDKNVIHLGDKPVVHYGDETFEVLSSSCRVVYKATQVRKFTLSNSPDGITGVEEVNEETPSGEQFVYERESIVISGTRPYTSTWLYDIQGRMIGGYKADSTGCTVIPMSLLPSGIIIVKTETLTYKIIK